MKAESLLTVSNKPVTKLKQLLASSQYGPTPGLSIAVASCSCLNSSDPVRQEGVLEEWTQCIWSEEGIPVTDQWDGFEGMGQRYKHFSFSFYVTL